MENSFIISFVITFLFCILKFVEMKYLDKEIKPLKFFIRDAIIVFISSLAGSYIFFQMNGTLTELIGTITDNKVLNGATTQIFTEAPGF